MPEFTAGVLPEVSPHPLSIQFATVTKDLNRKGAKTQRKNGALRAQVIPGTRHGLEVIFPAAFASLRLCGLSCRY
jgi:hypothetical protein